MINPSVGEKMGIIDTIKSYVNPEFVAHKFGLNKVILADVGVYGAIGFIAGFLLKRYSEYFISLVLLVIGLILLQRSDCISLSINSAKIHEMLGLQDIPMTGDACGSFVWEFIQTHVVSSSSLVVGFLIGIKVG